MDDDEDEKARVRRYCLAFDTEAKMCGDETKAVVT
jgi:hypothetical protein